VNVLCRSTSSALATMEITGVMPLPAANAQ
jgi:hypothetical protein